MTDKRKRIEEKICGMLALEDPSGVNEKKYRNFFQTMNDKEFEEWITKFLNDPKANIRLDIVEFGDSNRKLHFENIEKAAEFLGIDLFEYVYMPHLSDDKNKPVRTAQPVLVGWLNIKRPQQLVTKKNGVATSDTDRDEMTNAVRGKSKCGTQTGIENELLAGVGAYNVLSEIAGARADNIAEYDNMISSIAETGSVALKDIKTSIYDKPTLVQADMYLMAMGIKTDLISPSYYSVEKIRKAIDKSQNMML